MRAGVLLAHLELFARAGGDDDGSIAHPQRGLDRIGQAHAEIRIGFGREHEPVDDDLDVVFAGFRQADGLIQFRHNPVHPRPLISAGLGLQEHVFVGSLTFADDRREQQQLGARPQGENLIHDLGRGLAADRAAAARTEGRSGAREQDAQVVADLRHGPDGRTRILGNRFLLDRDRGA